MASQSLYRKWRSQTFSDMVGQEPIKETLKNALNGGTLAHAYLFTGPRGTGKTSTARLLAKTINCLHPKDGEPCNECQQCREITAGNSFNVIEIDAASNRGIDSIRELREKVMMPPSAGKYKVYILDEAHMLTVEAFNALLKTLEEPPPHAIFVLATTDVHKMLPTVISRCQRFDFKRFSMRQLIGHLNFVAEQEQVKVERGAAELIARAAAGGMRDALSLLDQAIAYCGQEISLEQVQAMLGVADPRAIQKLILHIAHLDSPAGLHLIHELAESGADLRQVNTQVAEYWRAMMLAKAGATLSTILDSTEDEVREIEETARLFGLEELIEGARIFAQNDLVQKSQGTPQLGLELALLASIEVHRRVQSGQSVQAAPPPATSPAPARPAPTREYPRTQSMAARPQAPRATEARIPPPPSPRPTPPPASEETTDGLPDWDALSYNDDGGEPEPAQQTSPVEHISAPVEPAMPPTETVAAQGGDAPLLTVPQVREKWEYVKRRVKTKRDGAMVAALLNDYAVVSIEGTSKQPIVVIQARADFHYNTLQKSDRHKIIEWALKIEFEQECRVRLLPPGAAVSGTPTIPPLPAMALNMTAPPASSPVRREPSAAQMPPASPSKPASTPEPRKQEPAPPHDASTPISTNDHQQPLARMNVVRENSSTASSRTAGNGRTSETRQESIQKKATGDPVVQKVVEMFKAEIKGIDLK
jgi:DNA polymerase-3 subunit gamma/tau